MRLSKATWVVHVVSELVMNVKPPYPIKMARRIAASMWPYEHHREPDLVAQSWHAEHMAKRSAMRKAP